MAGLIFLMRSHVNERYLTGLLPAQQLLAGDRILGRAEHRRGRDCHVGQMLIGDDLHQREQPRHVIPGEPVVLAGPVAASLDQAAALQRLQISRCRSQVHPRRSRDRLDRAFTLGEQVEDLQSPAVTQRLTYPRDLLQQRRLAIGLSGHSASPRLSGILIFHRSLELHSTRRRLIRAHCRRRGHSSNLRLLGDPAQARF
ncbi:hypothetical protein I547_2054 [Mycobacterium kansasii 824]|nr:hypothetical protein I547_2054 [Mycobacterium kansasii 824]